MCSSFELVFYSIVLYQLYYSFLQQNPDRMNAGLKAIFFTLVIVYLVDLIKYSEAFHFEVSPWKKTCLSNHPERCSDCCLPGFNGQPLGFHYISDTDRMNSCSEPSIDTIVSNDPKTHASLAETYGVKEGYGCGKTHQPSVEGYCGSCGLGGGEI